MTLLDVLSLKVNNSCRKDKSVAYEIRAVAVLKSSDSQKTFPCLAMPSFSSLNRKVALDLAHEMATG